MARLPAQCPSCSAQLRIRRLGCPECNTQLEGDFELPGVLQLPPEDLLFVTEFVRASGSLKEMARLEGQSYPTIRNRLNQIIERLNRSADGRAHEQHEILDALARGELTAQQAAKLLRKVDE
ncbi:MAG: DUF2089 domain-containing protein [Deltaproteobacteria bacterium]